MFFFSNYRKNTSGCLYYISELFDSKNDLFRIRNGQFENKSSKTDNIQHKIFIYIKKHRGLCQISEWILKKAKHRNGYQWNYVEKNTKGF